VVTSGIAVMRGCHRVAVVMLLALAVCACRSRPATPAARRPANARADVSHLHVLMVNGGGSREHNYQSHLLHLRALYDLLERAGVPSQRMALYVSDGADPAPDVALREAQPEPDFWLLEGSPLADKLRTPITFENSVVPDAALAPATRGDIARWFETTGRKLRPDDTLLLYVTDHGSRNTDDPTNNAITLWGRGERLPVRDLAGMLRNLDPGVRVVALMSQCFSGGFAELARARSSEALPDGSTCGYFSSTADRPAYGCYAENRGRDNVGHSFHFIEALAERGEFPAAHTDVLVGDDTPDVPLRTSDLFLEDVLQRAAQADGVKPADLIDPLLRQAWGHPESWEPELRLLDRVGHAYGFASPRSMGELEEQLTRMPELAAQLRTQHTAWQGALESATGANVDRFLAGHPTWQARLQPLEAKGATPEEPRPLTTALLRDLAPATRANPEAHRRLGVLHQRAEDSESVAYRMDVRAGVLLRMRAILVTIAGRTYLESRGSDEERKAYDALRRCEGLALPPVPLPPEAHLAPPEPFPSLEDDLAIAARVTPAWMGIQFRQAAQDSRASGKLADGAASVLAVYDGSPARQAGLEPGDIVIGPRGKPFQEKDQIREWTMLSRVDEPVALDVRRGDRQLAVNLVPKPFPQKWPSLPGPPKVGSAAPPLHLGAYRGTPPVSLAKGTPHLLFFWATWCAICKSALPEIAAFERERGIPVVAISDEDRGRLDPFFASHTGPFPPLVAIDENRQAFLAYAVSGMPTFVLVDGSGKVRSYATGYSPAKGLAVDGWTWSARPQQPAG
jgi:thiol-disulfide isomerase/thioredoxin